jgi:hypothetical protein
MLNVFGLFKSSGLSAQATAWQNKIISTFGAGTIDTATVTIIDNNLIKPMLAAGIWDNLDKLHLWAGVTSQNASTINLINPDLYGAAITGNTQWLNNSGIRSTNSNISLGGVIYFNQFSAAGYNPSTATKWSADKTNNGQFIMMLNPALPAGSNMMGTGSGTATYNTAMNRTSAQGLRIFSNATTAALNSSVVTTGKVWFAGWRSGNNVSAIIDSTSVTTSIVPSATILNQNIAELAINGQTVTINLDVSFHMASGHGNGNYDNQVLKTYLLNTFTALGI